MSDLPRVNPFAGQEPTGHVVGWSGVCSRCNLYAMDSRIALPCPGHPPVIRWLDVLAGAYRGGRRSLAHTRAHAVPEGSRATLCGKLSTDKLADGAPSVSPMCDACRSRVINRNGFRTSDLER